MDSFLTQIKQKAHSLNKKIIFPETEDSRTLEALVIIQKEQTCLPVLIGNEEKIRATIISLKLEIDCSKLIFIDNQDQNLQQKFAQRLFELRKEKGLTFEESQILVKNKNYFSTLCLEADLGDGLISGAMSSTADTVRPALQIIKTKSENHRVSGLFFMILPGKVLLFADCAINIEPTSEELAMIAIDSAKTAQQFNLDPAVALLSFSTNGSAEHPLVSKVQQAVKIAKEKAPDLIIDGEMQADAALIESVRLKKFPNSKLKNNANILIFPDLQSGNIGYKLVERLAGAEAIGPILQGLKKPVNDLSRGCKASDISNLAAFTACQTIEIYKIS